MPKNLFLLVKRVQTEISLLKEPTSTCTRRFVILTLYSYNRWLYGTLYIRLQAPAQVS